MLSPHSQIVRFCKAHILIVKKGDGGRNLAEIKYFKLLIFENIFLIFHDRTNPTSKLGMTLQSCNGMKLSKGGSKPVP